MAQKILVIEDNVDISQLICFNLQNAGYETASSFRGDEGVKKAQQFKPDLILLDIMLPGLTGLEVCKALKGSDLKAIPIIFLTAKGEEPDIISGLELGADDYMTKPFSPKILMARVQAVLRRNVPDVELDRSDADLIQRNNISIHLKRHEVRVTDELVKLTPSEFQILTLLANKPGWVFSRNQIVDAIHGQGYAVTDRSIDFQMVGLRKKLGSAGPNIETIRGVGYRYNDENE